MTESTLGLLHPGAMGSTVGAAARRGGARVLWASEGRSAATRARAETAGLEDAGTLAALVGESDVVFSVCPPSEAEALARAVAGCGAPATYVDANAVSPETARRIARLFDGTATSFVDGGIVGPPAQRPGTTRLHLSGERAAEVAALFAAGPIAAHVVEGPPGAASALKMVFAAYTKGTTALLAAIHAVAVQEGVHEALMREWERSLPDLPARSAAAIPASALKAWRFVGEMREISATFEAAGLPGGFHAAAAEIYSRLADFKEASGPPDVKEVADRLRRRSG